MPWDGKTDRRRERPCDDEMVERIAESAVRKAFKYVGIDIEEEDAQESLKGLVTLAGAFSKTKKAAVKEFTKLLGQLIALAFLYYISAKLGFFDLLEKLRHFMGGN